MLTYVPRLKPPTLLDARKCGNCRARLNHRGWTMFDVSLNPFRSLSSPAKDSRNLGADSLALFTMLTTMTHAVIAGCRSMRRLSSPYLAEIHCHSKVHGHSLDIFMKFTISLNRVYR